MLSLLFQSQQVKKAEEMSRYMPNWFIMLAFSSYCNGQHLYLHHYCTPSTQLWPITSHTCLNLETSMFQGHWEILRTIFIIYICIYIYIYISQIRVCPKPCSIVLFYLYQLTCRIRLYNIFWFILLKTTYMHSDANFHTCTHSFCC